MPEGTRDRRPSFWAVIAHDLLLSGAFGAVMAIAAAPIAEAQALGWSWYWQAAAIAVGMGVIVTLAWLRDLGFGGELAKRVEAFYEAAQLDRAFQVENKNLNARETVVGFIVYFVWLLLTAVPVITGSIAAVAMLPWAREHWPLILSIVIVPLTISIALAYRIPMYVAVRTEEWLVARKAR